MKVSDEDAYLSRNMTIKANDKIVKEQSESGSTGNGRPKQKEVQPTAGKKKRTERNRINHVTREIVFQPLLPDPGAPLYEERMIAV